MGVDGMKQLGIAFLVVILAAGYVACGGGEDEPTVADSDGDGWTDAWEAEVGTDPFSVDTDGDGHQDSADENPLDAAIPASPTPSPTATSAPQPSPAASATRTPGSTWTPAARPISADILRECYEQFRSEHEDVTSATARQTSDYKRIILSFWIHWDVPHAQAKPLAEAFVRLVKAKVDVPPGTTIGPGSYEYVPEVYDAGGTLLVQGMKCAPCDSMTWPYVRGPGQ
jgi:hypothetical protein